MFLNKPNARQDQLMINEIIGKFKNDSNLNVETEVLSFIKNQLVNSDRSPFEISRLIDNLAIELNNLHPNHSRLASTIVCNYYLYDRVEKNFSDSMKRIYELNKSFIADDVYEIILNNKELLDQEIDHNMDMSYSYLSLKAFEHHLIKIDGAFMERPQHMLMRVALGVHKHDVKSAIEAYKLMSSGWFIYDSSILLNSGTNHPSLSSSFQLTMKEDSLPGIYDTLKQIAVIMKKTNNIGLDVNCIRACDSYISGSNGYSNGLVSMLKVFDETCNYLKNEKQNALTVYLEPWHYDIFEFLDLKKNTGEVNLRTRELFYALWVPDLFMQRVRDDKDWSLIDPNQSRGLHEVYGDDFVKLYEQYENENKFKKQVKARDVWNAILNSQIETGSPFILYKDHCNGKSNQQNLGTIKCSNLSTEIIQYSSADEIATSQSASIALHKFVDEKELKFNFNKLKEISKIVVRNLNKTIDNSFYSLTEAEKSIKRNRPISISTCGLADAFILMRYAFDSEEAHLLNIQIFETIYYGALEASCELAKDFGPYETYEGSPVSKGQLQYDMWDTKPSDLLDWHELKNKIKNYGVRNSLLIAQFDSKSSQILNCNNCSEPFSSYVQELSSSIVINHHLLKDLVSLNLWDDQMMREIVKNEGSIQNIHDIPDQLKQIYKTSWELKQKILINLAASRAPFVDQSQQMNVHIEDLTFEKLTSMHFYIWSKNLKTGLYQLNSKPSQLRTSKVKFSENFIRENSALYKRKKF